MGNPLFNVLGGAKGQRGGPSNMIQAFQQFMQENQGKDPNEMIQQMLTSGKITQSQLDQAQQMAKKMGNQFNGMRSLFGFK